MPPKRFNKKAAPKRSKTSAPGAGSMFRVQLRYSILEGALGPVVAQSCTYPMPTNYKVFGRFKIIRVGFEVDPGTYMEIVVRLNPTPSLDTRGELARQPDCVKYKNLQAGPWIKWYRPLSPRAKSWQIMGPQMEVDMYAYWTGLNNLLDGSTGLLGNVIIDLQFDGLTLP